MDNNNLFHNRYFLERLLGRGNFSEVWLAKDVKTDIEVALKIFAPATGLDDHGINMLSREFAIVVNANHKNLLKPLYYDNFDRKPYLVLPYCKNGSIQRNIGQFTEEQAWHLLHDAASGLAFLHSRNPVIIHQDIKPDNIMIGDDGSYMITDFGVSAHSRSALRKSVSEAFSSAGTVAYMAPERFSKDNTPIMANDIYSLGATVFEMLTGDAPFGGHGGVLQKNGAEIPEIKGNYSSQLKKTITKCLSPNPWERPTAEILETYASEALSGTQIKFVDEKPFWAKYKYALVAIILLLFVVMAYGIKMANDREKKLFEIERAQLALEYNDSIMQVIKTNLEFADRLMKQGDAHEEYYENAYLDAYQKYQETIEANENFQNGTIYENISSVKEKMIRSENMLKLAYQSFIEKRQLFLHDDPQVAKEFDERAQKIAKVINVSSTYESPTESINNIQSEENE